MIEVDAEEDSNNHIVVEETRKRDRGRPKSNTKIVAAKEGKRKGKTLRPSAVNVVLGCSKSHVPDPSELRQQREADAAACGRQVRTVFEPVGVESPVAPITTTTTAAQFDRQTGLAPPGVLSSPPKTSAIAARTDEDFIERDEMACASRTQLDSKHAAAFLRRSEKESVSVDCDESTPALAGVRSNVHHDRQAVEMDTDMHSKEIRPRLGTRHYSQRASFPHEFFEDLCGQRVPRRSNLPTDGGTSEQRCSYESSRGSPGTFTKERWSPGRGLPRNEACKWRSSKILSEYNEENAYAHYRDHEYRRSTNSYNRQRRGRPRYGSFSLELDYRPMGSHSIEQDMDFQAMRSCSLEQGPTNRRMSFILQNAILPMTISRNAYNEGVSRCRAPASVKEEALQGTSPTEGRKERQQKQSSREEDMERHEKDGKKSFYLQLDGQGQPYGPGRPAWVVEINKLAKWLDPSCTHIWKQTYESVQTFKDRLNQTFDYLGKLNEDYLRGMMEKAVTRKRAELLSLIKNKGKQPKTIDRAVWLRLQKLANSKQREEKSKQGRYANACRKTLNRTGARRVYCVLEKLRSLYRRSPHPDEVEEEMQRDKGYGGQKRKKHRLMAEDERNRVEAMSSDEGGYSKSSERSGDGSFSDEGDAFPEQRRGRHVSQKGVARGEDDDVEEVDARKGRRRPGHSMDSDNETEKLSNKDKFIRKLQEKIQQLEADIVDPSKSKSRRP